MIAAEGEGLFDRLVNNICQTWFVRIAKLFIEGAQSLLRAQDQIIVFQDQVSGRRVRVQIFQRMSVPVLRKVHDLIQV